MQPTQEGGDQLDYGKLIEETLRNPDSAFERALEAHDPTALALISIASPGTDPARAVARFRALVEREREATTTEFLLVIFEREDEMPEELVGVAESFLQELRNTSEQLPAAGDQESRMLTLIGNKDSPDGRRALLLDWLNEIKPNTGHGAATEILADPTESFDGATEQAVLILGTYPDKETRQALATYAEEQLATGVADPSAPSPQPAAALYVLNSLRGVSDEDLEMIGGILARVAEHGLDCEDALDRLLGQLGDNHIKALVERLASEGRTDWLAEQLVPALVRARSTDVARLAGEQWWPDECLEAIAMSRWDTLDDHLYPRVLEQLHRRQHEDARLQIRERVADRCQNTTSQAQNEMPRIGIRSLLKLVLRDEIPTTDEQVLAALQGVDSDVLRAEVDGANWNSPERARRLGHLLAQVDAAILSELVGRVVQQRPKTAAALIEGATAPLLEPHIDEVLIAVDDVESVLTPLCRDSETAAAKTLERWKADQPIVAFRALASSPYSEERLNTIANAVRAYPKHTPAERAEMLHTFDLRPDRVDLLLAMLADRVKPAPDRPHTDDLVEALSLLGEHLAAGHDPERIVDAIAVICREALQPAVRRAGYEALGKSPPTEGLVDLLLERKIGEAANVRPVVQTALYELANKLEARATDPAASDRAQSAAQLALIDPKRAAVHARELLTADQADDRKIAATILGEAGSEEDADILDAVASNEPHPEVRRELLRAARRLRIGDIAEAHERLGELAGIQDTQAWALLDPEQLYAGWKDALVTGLDRVARAESDHDFGTAIDQLDEVAKALLFRAIDVAGESIGITEANRARAATNDLDYGDVLNWQQIAQNWGWVHYLGSLHGLRTEHIAARGSLTPPSQRTADDLNTAFSFFQLGALPCLELLAATSSPS